VESEEWTVHSPHQTQLEKLNAPSPPPTRKIREVPSLHDTTSFDCMEIQFLKFADAIFGLNLLPFLRTPYLLTTYHICKPIIIITSK
jgi:hypothetical protein